ncbi:hypothetical protein H7X87_03180 [Acetobacteraceae bacterium]|nr:hypothetical protein [Candidatus Parcubacteria bacterium]
MIDPIRGSVWRSNVHFFVGTIFLATCGLWAGLVMVQAAWGINPISQAFASTINSELQLPD